MLYTKLCFSRSFLNSWLAYWLPRSEWNINPTCGLFRCMAIERASVTISFVILFLMKAVPGTPYLITDKSQRIWFIFSMARMARAVVPGIPHHVTQRGNRRQQTFFNNEDYQSYLELMSEWCMKFQVETWAYYLMLNHIHLIIVPETKDSLNQAIGEAHRRYTRRINFREGWRGHLWQGRFSSFIMDERYLLACTRYVELIRFEPVW